MTQLLCTEGFVVWEMDYVDSICFHWTFVFCNYRILHWLILKLLCLVCVDSLRGCWLYQLQQTLLILLNQLNLLKCSVRFTPLAVPLTIDSVQGGAMMDTGSSDLLIRVMAIHKGERHKSESLGCEGGRRWPLGWQQVKLQLQENACTVLRSVAPPDLAYTDHEYLRTSSVLYSLSWD